MDYIRLFGGILFAIAIILTLLFIHKINIKKGEGLMEKNKVGELVSTSANTRVIILDEKGQGGANHHYQVVSSDDNFETASKIQDIHFQKGPVKEFGSNGLQNEDLLKIVIHRLQGFQSGNFACRDNAVALTHAETALMWLQKRTRERIERGVEGTNKQ
jgi:hypothetical protein